MNKLYVHGWTAKYMRARMDRYGIPAELLATLSGLPEQHIRNMMTGSAEIYSRVAALIRLYGSAPKSRRKVISQQISSVTIADPVVWRPISGFPAYEVSESGEIRRDGRILVATPNRHGHLGVTLYNGSKQGAVARGRKIQVHQIVANAFLGDPPFVGALVRHLNGYPWDNRPANLCWGTAQENVADRIRHHRFGKPHPSVDVTWTVGSRRGRTRGKHSRSNGLVK